MARKKSPQNIKKEFVSTPFNQLKGVSVPDPTKPKPVPVQPQTPAVEDRSSKRESFHDEMVMLGVKPLHQRDDDFCQEAELTEIPDAEGADELAEKSLSGDELFLSEMQDLEVRFSEPDYEDPASGKAESEPRRMKQLRQGRITPDASLDLHGFKRADVAGKIKYFIQGARYQGWQTLLVITGRGLHSESGEAVLREETEQVIGLIGKQEIAEWGYAPQRYGGKGAIVLFLKNKA